MRISLWSIQIALFVLLGMGSASWAEPIEPKKNPTPPLLPGEIDPVLIPPTNLPKKAEPATDPMKVESKEDIKPLRFDSAETKTFEQVWIARREGMNRDETIRVGFYNHADREILLEVDGKPLKLPSLHYLLFKRTRSFSWRQKEGDLQKVFVPTDVDGVEVIFKK